MGMTKADDKVTVRIATLLFTDIDANIKLL